MIGAGAGLGLIVVGAFFRVPALIAVGAIVELVWLLRSLWTRFGLRGLTYERRLDTPRASVGEEIELDLIVRNRKILPVPWLAVEDQLTRGSRVVGRTLKPSVQPGVEILRTTWTLGWFQRVTRRLRIAADHRGVYDFRGVSLLIADLFARDTVVEERELPLRYAVFPRSVPVRGAMELSDVPGSARSRRGLFEEPTLYSGVRPYHAGDPLRRVHWKATARLGRPVSRRYEPGHEREIVIALDAQTVAGPFWLMRYREESVEGLCMAALSLSRSLIDRGSACGLAANGYTRRPERTLYLAPSAAPAQIARIADALAALSRWASLPFVNLLDGLGQRTAPTSTILALTSLPTTEVLQVLRRLQLTGRQVRLCAFGPQAADRVTAARRLGIPAAAALLNPDWQTSDALDLVG